METFAKAGAASDILDYNQRSEKSFDKWHRLQSVIEFGAASNHRLKERLNKLCRLIELALSDASFIPRSGSDLQPNVARSAATLGMNAWKRAQPHIGVEADWNSSPRVAAAATLGWRSGPLRGT